MNNKPLLIILLMALIAPWAANAQVADKPLAIPDSGKWNEPNTWIKSGSQVPTAGTDVYISGDVTIPAGYTAVAGEVTIADGGSLTIEEGAQFIHTGMVHGTVKFTFNASNAKDDEFGNCRLIASPITPFVTVTSTGLIPADTVDPNYKYVDLYYFDEEEDGWIDYKDPTYDFSTLDITKGYLYVNPKTVHFTFFGYVIPTILPVEVDLSYTEGNVNAGLNLVGNPFTCSTYITDGNHQAIPYDVMDENGEYETKAPGTPLAPLKGAFVEATATGQKVIFTTTPPNFDKSVLNITVNQANVMVDNAIVNFGNGSTLGKLQLNPNHTKVYMPVEGKDYAVAKAESQGEMPVNFKAEKNGTYTMSFTNEEVTFSYLHLIDNLTGKDVDLLATPSYTIEAKVTDYASRFKLVYATGEADHSEEFAFVNNGEIIINGEGTVQVIDMLGHQLFSRKVNSSLLIPHSSLTPGIYVLRLINGDEVKTQKIVIN